MRYKCDKCHGIGSLYVKFTLHKNRTYMRTTMICDRCNGSGESDWIYRIMSQPEIFNWSDEQKSYIMPLCEVGDTAIEILKELYSVKE